jgi:hypothetical protein
MALPTRAKRGCDDSLVRDPSFVIRIFFVAIVTFVGLRVLPSARLAGTV